MAFRPVVAIQGGLYFPGDQQITLVQATAVDYTKAPESVPNPTTAAQALNDLYSKLLPTVTNAENNQGLIAYGGQWLIAPCVLPLLSVTTASQNEGCIMRVVNNQWTMQKLISAASAGAVF